MSRFFIKNVGTLDDNGMIHKTNLHIGLNVIFGRGHTGKSTVIEVIDYCLGKSSSGIAEKIDKVSNWHFIVCQNDNTFFVARSAKHKSVFKFSNLNESYSIENIKEILYSADTYNWEDTNEYLFVKSGMEMHAFYDYSRDKFIKMSFRNCLSFCLQPYGLCTDKTNLLYRFNVADSFKKASIQTEYPTLFGLIKFEYYNQIYKKQNLESEIERINRIIKKKNNGQYIEQIQGKVHELFVLTNNQKNYKEVCDSKSFYALKRDLSEINYFPKNPDNQGLYKLTKEKSSLELELSDIRMKIDNLIQQKNSYDQLSRFYNSKLMMNAISIDFLNDIKFKNSNDIQKFLEEEKKNINKELSKINYTSNENISVAIGLLEKTYDNKRELLAKVEKIIQNMIDQSEKFKYTQEKYKQAYSLEVEIIEKFNINEVYIIELEDKLKKLTKDLKSLKSDLSEYVEELDTNKENFENAVSGYINESIKPFFPNLEYENNILFGFELKKMDIYYKDKNKKIFMEKWGSEVNALFAHLSCLLALQRNFSENEKCVVPKFITLDQISRAYFPSEKNLTDDLDFKDLKLVYELIDRIIKDIKLNTGEDLQVIALEHANGDNMGKKYMLSKIKDDMGNSRDFTKEYGYLDLRKDSE